jgi:guanine deaminase
MKGYRAALLRFDPAADPKQSAVYDTDGLLVVGPDVLGTQVVQAAGAWTTLAPRYPGLAVEHLPGRLIAPGFVDLHLHYPQTNVIGSPASGLLPWLENYTFPEEQRFESPDYSAAEAAFFLDELLRHGVTTALTFATSHPASVQALFTAAQQRQLRVISGLCLMDRHAPAALLNRAGPGGTDATEQSLIDSESLLQQWQGVGRLGYAITPRFAPTSSDAWRPATRRPGSSRMWPKTRTKSPGRGPCSRNRAATWPPTPTLVSCVSVRSTPIASILTMPTGL